MKLIDVANDYLKWMIESYETNNNRNFHWNQIRAKFPDLSEDMICDAFRMLSKDGLVENKWADNHVFLSVLDVTAIANAERNTLLVKTYRVLKEIREWIKL